jgi:GNAT superfamily N-acetyltransferase
VSAIEIFPVRDRRALQQFIDFPYSLYRSYPHWVPPLRIAMKEMFDPRKHPFHRHGSIDSFLALRDGKVVGRISAILDPNHNKFHEEQAGFFGFFESVDDQAVATALLGAARARLHELGAKVIRGPLNPSTNYECGLLIDGFDSDPIVMMTYNPPYYATLIEGAGLVKAKDLYAYWASVSEVGGVKAERVAKRALKANRMTIRPIRMDDFDAEVARVFEVYNAAWSHNWGFVPMTKEEFFAMGKEMKMLLDPGLVLLGETPKGLAGFALALPDANEAIKHAKGRLFPFGLLKILYHKRSIRNVRVIALGVLEEYRSEAIAAGLYTELIRHARAKGYEGCESSWILEDNVLMNRSMEALGAKHYKTYRIYEWN